MSSTGHHMCKSCPLEHYAKAKIRGVGKTTNAVNLSSRLFSVGRRPFEFRYVERNKKAELLQRSLRISK